MTAGEAALRVRVARAIHAGLRVEADFSVADECVVVFGASGAGKSSLLRLIAGLDRPDEGRIELAGDLLFDSATKVNRPLRERGVGMVFQKPLLLPHRTVEGNIRFGLSRFSRREAEERLGHVAKLFGIEPLLARKPQTLSGGELQRVSLARALAPGPRLLLADEPFSALDLPSRLRLGEHLKRVRRAERVPMLLVTHSPAEAVELGDRMLVVDSGRVVASGPPLEALAAWRPGGRSTLDRPGLGLRNVWRARIAGPTADGLATRVVLPGGPELIVPSQDAPTGTEVLLEIRSEDIMLARGLAEGLSARNILPGVVERVVMHGPEAEVVARTGEIEWIVSVVERAVGTLGLEAGEEVKLVIKARSCHVFEEGREGREGRS